MQVGTEALKEAFQDAGEIVSAVVMRDQTGTSRGFGFVNFEKPEDADKAIANFNDTPHTQGTWLVRMRNKIWGSFPDLHYTRGVVWYHPSQQAESSLNAASTSQSIPEDPSSSGSTAQAF